MIFVSVGMMNIAFHRLLSKMNELAPSLDEEVVMQVGFSDEHYPNVRYQKFFDADEMKSLYDSASVIVCHAGVGTILNGLERNIPVVMVPRKADLKEVSTDHQFMIADQIEAMGRGIKVIDVENLKDAILKAKAMTLDPYVESRTLVNYLSDVFSEIESLKK